MAHIFPRFTSISTTLHSNQAGILKTAYCLKEVCEFLTVLSLNISFCSSVSWYSVVLGLAEWVRKAVRSPRSRVLFEKVVKKFSVFYGTRKFITALTRARQLSLSLKNFTCENVKSSKS